MLNIGNKNFMNLQEAVGWLLENNALPFQSTANYAGNTEIGMSTLINPSPAKVRVGSIIFFADSKVSTVIGVTSNSFIVSDQYNDLVDDVVYVSNVAINASGHLIVTLSNGDTIDAGLIKQVSNFSIDASQHLIASYNDGSTTDLGAIFSGNITVSGNLTVSGGISGDSIIENMSGYNFAITAGSIPTNLTLNIVYAGAVKNGNKLTLVIFGNMTRTGTISPSYLSGALSFSIPKAVSSKIYPYNLGGLTKTVDSKYIQFAKAYDSIVNKNALLLKYEQPDPSPTDAYVLNLYGLGDLDLNETYIFRYECTFLLSDNLAS